MNKMSVEALENVTSGKDFGGWILGSLIGF